MTKSVDQRWKTAPLDCWRKCKELSVNHYKDVAAARQRGRLLISGGAASCETLPAGLGDYVFFSGEPYGASVSYDTPFSEACVEASEAHGFARDLCAYMRNYWGSMFLDRYLLGGPFPKPNFFLTAHECDSHAKWYQVAAEHLGVPYFAIEWPLAGYGEKREARIEYVTGQMLDAIDWMEKVTGREYDDEKFVEALDYECEGLSYFARVLTLNQAIPAPLDMKALLTLYAPAALIKHTRESRDFYKMLCEEVQYRVDNHIASVATERFRVWHDNVPPWFFLHLLRILEQYGVACVSSFYLFAFAGFVQDQGGNCVPAPTPKSLGLRFKHREDAVRFYAQWLIDRPGFDMYSWAGRKTAHLLKQMERWHAGAMIMHLNRGCEGLGQYQLELRSAMLAAGIPVLAYEGNMADKRELDERQVVDRVEAFMESLGLKKLES
ncbi:MAG: 2-hydroxyacyl-CoA dehydratase [Chloroflexi bacterium]|nr:2-hydroxyacyl-CoA dehydratase [Chloroflexota bacterium]